MRLILFLLLIPSFAFGQIGRFPMHSLGGGEAAPVGSWTNLVSCWPMNETSGDAEDVEGGDDGTVYSGTQTTGGFISAAGADSISITGVIQNTPGTWIMLCNITSNPINIIGGDAGCMTLTVNASNRLRVLEAGATGTDATSMSITQSTWQLISIRVDPGDSIRYGINDSYETETWSQTITKETTILAGGYYSWGYRGTIRNVFYFSDLKTDSYITAFYNGGSFTDYEDGDPE